MSSFLPRGASVLAHSLVLLSALLVSHTMTDQEVLLDQILCKIIENLIGGAQPIRGGDA